MRSGDTIRFSSITVVEPGMQLGWKAGGKKPHRLVYVALVLGVEPHPDDIPGESNFDELYALGTLIDPNEVLKSMGWVHEKAGWD